MMYGQNPNPYFNQFQNPYGSFGYQQPAPMIKPVQPLTQEEINHLRTQVNELTNVALTPDEVLKAKCTHKFKDGRYSLIPLDPNAPENGDVVCEICGAQFNLNTVDESTVNSAVAIVKNVMQQTKTLWPDIPEPVATEYMMTEPLLGKLAGLYKVANDHNAKYMNSININPQQMGYANGGFGTGNAFDIFNGYTGGAMPMYGAPMYQQPPMGYPQQPVYQQPPMGYQQPVAPNGYPQQQAPMYQQPPMGYPQQPVYQQPPMGYQQPVMNNMGYGGNPFGYETTMAQPQQQVPTQPVAPQAAPQAPVAPATAAPAAASANNGTVEVKKQFSL